MISEQDCLALIPKVVDRAINYSHSRLHSNESIDTPARETGYIRGSVGFADVEDDDLISEIKASITRRDSTFVTGRKEPRPKRPIYQGRKSPSHFLLFGALGVTTGLEAYDNLYQDVANLPREPLAVVKKRIEDFAIMHAFLNPDDKPAIEEYLGHEIVELDEERKKELLTREALNDL